MNKKQYNIDEIETLYENNNLKEVEKIYEKGEISDKDRDEWLLHFACYYNHTALATTLSNLNTTKYVVNTEVDNGLYKQFYIDPFSVAISNNNETLAINLFKNKNIDISSKTFNEIINKGFFDLASTILECNKVNKNGEAFEKLSKENIHQLIEIKPHFVADYFSKDKNNVDDLLNKIDYKKFSNKQNSNFQKMILQLEEIKTGGSLFDYLTHNRSFAFELIKNVHVSVDCFNRIIYEIIPYTKIQELKEGIAKLTKMNYTLDDETIIRACIHSYIEDEEDEKYAKYLVRNFNLLDNTFFKNRYSDIAEILEKDIKKEKIQQNVMNF